MIEQTAQVTEAVVKIPVSVIIPGILFLLGQLFLIIRELLKFKEFKAKNGTLDEIKQGIIAIQTNCHAVSTALTKQTDSNSKEILDLWKERGKKADG